MENINRQEAIKATARRKFHAGHFKYALCAALLDVLRFVFEHNPLPALQTNHHFRGTGTRLVRGMPDKFLAYRRVHWFQDKLSDMKACVESERQGTWLPNYRLTFYADDCMGLDGKAVLAILRTMPSSRLTFCEFALDFSVLSGIDRSRVLSSAVFGKSQRDLNSTNPTGDWWGARRGPKRVVSYYKDSVWAHRVEFKLQKQFLRRNGIHNLFDLVKLAKILPRHHILLGRLDNNLLEKRLRRQGYSSMQVAAAFKQIEKRETDLSRTLRFLRRSLGIANTRRLLIPTKANQLVRYAIAQFVTGWPKTSKTCGGKP